MSSKTRFAAILLLALCVDTVAHAEEAASSSNVTLFPPANGDARGGLLYFNPGATQSMYAVPVMADPNLISAVNNNATTVATAINGQANAMTAAIAQQTDAINAQTAVLQSLAGKLELGATDITPPDAKVSFPSTVTCTFNASADVRLDTSSAADMGIARGAGTVNIPFAGIVNGTYTYGTLNASTGTGSAHLTGDVLSGGSGNNLNELDMTAFMIGVVTYDAHSGKLLNQRATVGAGGWSSTQWNMDAIRVESIVLSTPTCAPNL